MKYYRVHRSESGDGSHGYEFYTDKRDAMRAAREWIRRSSDEGGVYDARISVIVVPPTKLGVLGALRLYAAHPDNG